MNAPKHVKDYEVILGNSNPRFSGVTSTMLQTLEVQTKEMNIGVLGKHHLPDNLEYLATSFIELISICKHPLSDGRYRVFHARRNDEMIQALILKYVFRAKIRIVFTSTAQRYHSKFTRWLMSKMDCVISTCKAAASYLKVRPSAIIPHGIQSEVYKPNPNMRNKDKTTIAMFGRVREQKGTHLFVNACITTLANKPNVDAIIVGAITPENTEFVNHLKNKIKENGLQDRIRFLGEQPFSAIPGLFQQTSLVAALSRTEGFGLTVLEALSSGAAVLATQAGAWPEIVEQGVHGYVVPINDQTAITEKLELLLSDTNKLKQMGCEGRKLVERKFRIETEAKKLCEIYRSLQ